MLSGELAVSGEEVTIPSHALSSLGLTPLVSLSSSYISSSPTGTDRLLAAAAKGNLHLVITLVESGRAHPDPTAHNGRSPLHAAAEHGHAEIVQYLAAKGADVNRTSHPPELHTPLHDAISGIHTMRWMNEAPADLRSLAVARELVNKGASVHAKDGNGDTPAHIAAREKDICVLIFLVNHDPTLLNVEDKNGKTLLQIIMDDEKLVEEHRFLCIYILNLNKVALKRDQMGTPFQKNDDTKEFSPSRLRLSSTDPEMPDEDQQDAYFSGFSSSLLNKFIPVIITSKLDFQIMAFCVFFVNVLLEGIVGGQNVFLGFLFSMLLFTIHRMKKSSIRKTQQTQSSRKDSKVDLFRNSYLSLEVALIIAGNILYISDVFPYIRYTSIMFHLMYFSILLPAVYFLYKSSTVTPGYLTQTRGDFDALVKFSRQGFVPLDKFCIGCCVVKVQGVRHCRHCQKCVQNFDHHCPFISNCVSAKNMKPFYLTMVFFWSYLCFSIIFMLHFFSKLPHVNPETFNFQSDRILTLLSADVQWTLFCYFPGLFLFSVTCLVLLFGVSWLLVRHTRQIALRISTYQMLTKASECNTNISVRRAIVNIYLFLKN